ncbi:MAG: sigma-70 family RNA polymerase sigma factor [Bacteroidales bacterium]|nr:sigma-70 family RNA polymerase sigma factor [Bacteroidales bacterium]
MSADKDKELLEKLLNPEERDSAFSLLVEQYGERLYMHIRRMVLIHADADDVLQETFVKAYLALDTFRGDSQIFTWLYRIASNEALNFLKKKKRKHALNILSYENVLINSLHSDTYFDGDEADIKLQAAILKLPEKQRLVFNLRYYEEMPYNEMSEILNTSEGALKASYHHAVKKIKEELNL